MQLTLFLTDTDTISEVMTENSNTLRLDNVSIKDAETICKLSSKYCFVVAAFLNDEDA